MPYNELHIDDLYSTKKIENLRDKIRHTIINGKELGGRTVIPSAEEAINQHHSIAAALIAPAFVDVLKVSPTVVEQSLDNLFAYTSDGYVTSQSLLEAAWIMSANKPQLDNDVAVGPFTHLQRPEWAPIHVVDYHRGSCRGNKGGWFVLKVIGGRAVLQNMSKFFTGKARGFFKQMFDLPKYAKFELHDVVGMKSWVLLSPSVVGKEKLQFDRVGTCGPFTKDNRSLLKARGEVCVEEYNRACIDCEHGLQTCFRGTHAVTYQVRLCAECGNAAAWFSPGRLDDSCIRCTAAGKDMVTKDGLVKGHAGKLHR